MAQPLASKTRFSARPEIPQIDAQFLTPEVFFQQYQKPGRPVLIRGLLAPELDWNLDYLCQVLGSTRLPIRHYGQERYQQDKRQWTSLGSSVHTLDLPFSDYATLLRNGQAREQDLYLGNFSLKRTPLGEAPLLEGITAHLGLRSAVTSLGLWLGVVGHTTCLHYDAFDGTLMQLHGCKRLLLFPPAQTQNLYPFPLAVHLRHGLKLRSTYSRVYPERPDFTTFPRCKMALQQAYTVLLQPREVLYIPAGWWHEVTAVSRDSNDNSASDEVVCSVSCFWQVRPWLRSFCSWNQWRAYLGTVLATPYLLQNRLRNRLQWFMEKQS